MTDMVAPRGRGPVWLGAAAAFGVAWNAFGLIQLADMLAQTGASLMMRGMSAAAAEVYLALPGWMSVVFAIGAGGGVAGSVALALRRRVALQLFAASLAGYIALYAGDLAHGLFALIPGQQAILTTVVAIAVALLAVAWIARRRNMLR